MKFKFILATTLAPLQASAANWDSLVAAAVEAGVADAASLDASILLQRLTDDPQSSQQSQQSQAQSDQIRQLAIDLANRDVTIASLQSRITELQIELGKKPGAAPAQAVAETDPEPATENSEIGCLTGKESFVESLDRISKWL